MTIQLGCMNRPWGKFTFDDALGGIAAAGFANFGLLLMHQDAVVTGDTTPAEAAEVSARVRAHGLTVRMIPSNVPLDKGHDVAIRYLRTMIGHASALDVRILLEMGSSHPERYDDYFAVMRAAAPIAADHGVTIALKPHGGLSTRAMTVSMRLSGLTTRRTACASTPAISCITRANSRNLPSPN